MREHLAAETMNRITRKQADEMARILNRSLALPVEPYLQNPVTAQYVAQIGCIHICGQNGTNTICQMENLSGGVRGMAYGLTLREAYDWLSAAIEGVRLANKHGLYS